MTFASGALLVPTTGIAPAAFNWFRMEKKKWWVTLLEVIAAAIAALIGGYSGASM